MEPPRRLRGRITSLLVTLLALPESWREEDPDLTFPLPAHLVSLLVDPPGKDEIPWWLLRERLRERIRWEQGRKIVILRWLASVCIALWLTLLLAICFVIDPVEQSFDMHSLIVILCSTALTIGGSYGISLQVRRNVHRAAREQYSFLYSIISVFCPLAGIAYAIDEGSILLLFIMCVMHVSSLFNAISLYRGEGSKRELVQAGFVVTVVSILVFGLLGSMDNLFVVATGVYFLGLVVFLDQMRDRGAQTVHPLMFLMYLLDVSVQARYSCGGISVWGYPIGIYDVATMCRVNLGFAFLWAALLVLITFSMMIHWLKLRKK